MKNNHKFNYRLYFTGYIFFILLITLLVSGIVIFLLDLSITEGITTPIIFWMLLVSVVLGTSLGGFFSDKVLSPITKLNQAMGKVATGDFSVRLETSSILDDVHATYENFNLMVQELNATELLQSDFISNVSHEIKTPISAIEGYTMLLQEESISQRERQEYIEKILLNTRRLSELTRNVLLLSKVDNQAISAENHTFRLDEQIRQALLLLEPKWADRDLQFDVELAPVSICNCESLLLHVWTNLIDNAIKYNRPGGSIQLRLDDFGDDVVFSIADSGIGIPADVQPHIFDRFYQADNSRRSEGNGLGLALVKQILTFCSGSIVVRSQPGEGSCFTVRLPCRRAS